MDLLDVLKAHACIQRVGASGELARKGSHESQPQKWDNPESNASRYLAFDSYSSALVRISPGKGFLRSNPTYYICGFKSALVHRMRLDAVVGLSTKSRRRERSAGMRRARKVNKGCEPQARTKLFLHTISMISQTYRKTTFKTSSESIEIRGSFDGGTHAEQAY
ncbi:uncharacterized protein BDZ99DRAFT_89241 [Mytilinidion resinicola]|uniref:Uncharacterized protein n=1 Tax=Mytilinidion resinicola TaxID=574789 RepID=A0A6A6YDT8_9PEZI|nr:uncharacterized protein BDZ99DRAFT_89241 [Mytilinidion resinicola]KAF2806976.1 hypothetical protein BDZ99DRAFT_89241 [Mytilinidion resinicola]